MAAHNTIYCPTLLYGSEIWTLDSREYSRIQATEMKYLRRVVGKTKRDKIGNTTIRDQTNTNDIKTKIEVNQLRWFGHVNRMNDNRIAKSVYCAKPQGKRPKGRPRKKWEEDIKEALMKRNLTQSCQPKEYEKREISGKNQGDFIEMREDHNIDRKKTKHIIVDLDLANKTISLQFFSH